ncbi:MAG: hypothetical protein RBU37_27145, partial [Myxococcota bacterium]|nr:hypothetical protein [Myxococcota bacterium]
AATELDARLVAIKSGALIEHADGLFRGKDYLAAAAEYERILVECPEFEHYGLAMFNAAVAYEMAQDFAAALQLYERVAKGYAGTELAADALKRTVLVRESTGL